MGYKQRMFLQKTICCDNCANHIKKGTKFTDSNFRREEPNETYYGIQILRFHFNCPTCSSEITIRTDPMILHFVVERGATRRLIPWPVTPIEDQA